MSRKIRRVARLLFIVAAVALIGCDSVSAAGTSRYCGHRAPVGGLIPPAPHFRTDAVFSGG